jgi:hypothetical protein
MNIYFHYISLIQARPKRKGPDPDVANPDPDLIYRIQYIIPLASLSKNFIYCKLAENLH